MLGVCGMAADTALTKLRRIGRLVRPLKLATINYDPNDKRSCERLAERLFSEQDCLGNLGSAERGRNLLRIIGDSYPTEPLTNAYFTNLLALLDGRPKLAEPGSVLIGLGTGRCGSTTLASFLADLPGACSTHENPPLIFWRPESEQIQFHLRRFSILVNYFQLVSDCSHWWLNVAPDVFDMFPSARFIGLVREPTACANSFMAIKKFGHGSYNHWVPFANAPWIPAHWDPTYPTYDAPSDSYRNADRAKRALILRYIHEYNVKLTELASAFPDRFIVLQTEELNLPSSLQKISEFVGIRGGFPTRALKRNANSISDSRDLKLHF